MHSLSVRVEASDEGRGSSSKLRDRALAISWRIIGRMPAGPKRFMLMVYRMPTKPTAARVAVWRQLKKSGAIYLQQSVCVFPDNRSLRKDLAPILERITNRKGEFHLLPLRSLDTAESSKLIQQFQEQTST